MRASELKIRPVALVILTAALMWLVSRMGPAFGLLLPARRALALGHADQLKHALANYTENGGKGDFLGGAGGALLPPPMFFLVLVITARGLAHHGLLSRHLSRQTFFAFLERFAFGVRIKDRRQQP